MRKGLSTRPLLSRIRKSLFDILGDAIRGKNFLDLYAGTGAVGIEALSRGAKKVFFVEIDPQCVKIIEENVRHCGVASKTRIFQQDVLAILPYLLKKESFFFIFIGPPYFQNLQDKTLNIIDKSVCQAQIICQHHFKEKINFQRKSMQLLQQRKYGDTCLTFLKKSAYE